MGRLRSLPATAEALAEGSLGLAKASLIARAANERTEAALAGDEARLVEEARAHTVDDTARLMASWKARADLDGPVPAEGGERSRLHVSRSFGGGYLLDGELDAEGGAIVANELDALAERIYRGESAEGEVRSTPSQRKAAALVEMARRSAAAEPRAPARPLLLVLADLETLARRAGRGAEIVGTGPISAEAARRLACEAGLSRVLTDAAGAILDLGLSTRTPSPAQRRALVIRDGGCRFPGWDRGAGWCQAHHITHWADGGLTDLINLLLLCRRHHRLVHEGGFGLARGPDGALVFTRPDGTVLAARPLVA